MACYHPEHAQKGAFCVTNCKRHLTTKHTQRKKCLWYSSVSQLGVWPDPVGLGLVSRFPFLSFAKLRLEMRRLPPTGSWLCTIYHYACRPCSGHNLPQKHRKIISALHACGVCIASEGSGTSSVPAPRGYQDVVGFWRGTRVFWSRKRAIQGVAPA